ncbi:MAG: major capsid protein [Lachnospiraceae bacterium]|nr:major capsid protein [Lachnospiraceae bacterium]
MSINLYDTHTLLALSEVVKPKSTFLRDRYFPTAPEDIFVTEDVLVDYKDEVGNTLAPVVLPSKGGIQVEREGYETHQFTPPLVAPERPLTADQLKKRLPGEQVFSAQTPQEREARIVTKDIADLNTMIDNREEYMAAQTLLNNGYTLKQYADKYGSNEYVEKPIKFYNEASNPAIYTPSATWSTASTKIISDIAAMADLLTKRGLGATDLIVSGNVADTMLGNTEIRELLDNRRFILAQEVNPQERPNGSVLIAVLNVKGHLINVYSYTREYVDETTGVSTPFIPEGFVVVTAPGMGRTAYGAITQIEGETRDFVTYAAARVPHVIVSEHDNVRTLIQQSRPLVMPKVKNAAISAQVIF